MKVLLIALVSFLFSTISLAHEGQACDVSTPTGSYCVAKVKELHPTQMSVGMIEVQKKEKKIKHMDKDELEQYERGHPEPTVIGPEGVLYIIDHHHLARALYEQDVKHTYCYIQLNLSNLDETQFWQVMVNNSWVFPYNENGRGPLPFSMIPSSVAGLKDDPYRSLAGEVRDDGGYQKSEAPFSEFLWADFFRSRISRQDLEDDFDHAVKKGVKLAHSPEAQNLPGYEE